MYTCGVDTPEHGHLNTMPYIPSFILMSNGHFLCIMYFPVGLYECCLFFFLSSDVLREFFSRFGELTSANVMVDRETNRPRGAPLTPYLPLSSLLPSILFGHRFLFPDVTLLMLLHSFVSPQLSPVSLLFPYGRPGFLSVRMFHFLFPSFISSSCFLLSFRFWFCYLQES